MSPAPEGLKRIRNIKPKEMGSHRQVVRVNFANISYNFLFSKVSIFQGIKEY